MKYIILAGIAYIIVTAYLYNDYRKSRSMPKQIELIQPVPQVDTVYVERVKYINTSDCDIRIKKLTYDLEQNILKIQKYDSTWQNKIR